MKAGMREKAGKIIGSGILLFRVIAVVVTVVMVFTSPVLAEIIYQWCDILPICRKLSAQRIV